MSSLTLKGIPEALHEQLRAAAEASRRSLNREIIHRLERSLDIGQTASSLVREHSAFPYAAGVIGRNAEPEQLTLDEFNALPEEDSVRLELAAGRLVREPAPGFRHGRVAARVNRILWEAGEGTGHGQVFFDMGFLLAMDPPTVRVPDVSFVSVARLHEQPTNDEIYLAIAPDLAVEVLSPSNSASEIQRKAFEYLDAGASLVWIVDPSTATVTVYRARDDIRVLVAGEMLDATAAIPDLVLDVAELFGPTPQS
jgi:Uma2 family endonuclease